MEIVLKRAEPQDIDEILPLVAAFHAEEGVEQAPELRSGAIATLLENPAYGEIHLIESSDDLVGYLAFAYGFSIEFSGRDAFLDEIYISPGYRGHGFGRKALHEMKAHLVAQGVKAVHLEVAEDNLGAQSLYASEGFVLRRRYHLMSALLD